MAISQMVTGSLSILFEIVLVGLFYSGKLASAFNAVTAPGIWCGLLVGK
jgi:hypothetical protein